MSEFTQRHEELSELARLVREFFQLVDKVEESDSGTYFRPNQFVINSCRAMDGHRLGQIIPRMKEIVGAPPAVSEERLRQLNDQGKTCQRCDGSGWDKSNVHHEDWTDCKDCDGSGVIYVD